MLRKLCAWRLLLSCLVVVGMACSGGDGKDTQGAAPHDVICPVFDRALLPSASEGHADTTVNAGKVDGAFSVSAWGEARYRIPLVVPPGRVGMEPSLALTYSSGSGDGPLGVGVSLSGLSSISRCPWTLGVDGYARGVHYDQNDHLCLDGTRLVALSSSQSVLEGRVDEYRTLPDSFQRIRAFYPHGWDAGKGPSYFHVYARSGRILEYGAAPSGRVMGAKGLIRSWWLTRELDRHGNTIAYTYRNDLDPADGHTVTHTPLRIDYTGHSSAPASRAVVFDSFDWPNHTSGYTGGMLLNRAPHVTRIRMLGPGDVVVRSYELTYEESPSSGRARLVSVHECAKGDGKTCKPPTRFGWLDPPSSGFTKVTTAIPHPSSTADVTYQWLMADVTGDGLDDLVLAGMSPADSTSSEWRVATNTGNTGATIFASAAVWATTPGPTLGVYHDPLMPLWAERFHLAPVDYDLDGRADLFVSDSMGGEVRWLHAKKPGSFDHLGTGVVLPNNVNEELAHSTTLYADIDGDGVPDLIECNEQLTQGGPATSAPGKWSLRRWVDGGLGMPEPIPPLGKRTCLMRGYMKAVDLAGDGKSALLVPQKGWAAGGRQSIGTDR